ncbi:muskelin [Epargyreus clarus]|uniref:muskelin n=1 Tax=Epargyreus clarus TaxID=520877 RepID=UPI003C2B6769
MEDKYESVKLGYTIHKCSSYTTTFVPENILIDKPLNTSSRWFTDSGPASQYLVLKLDTPAIVQTIKFGKYIKAHVSDLRKFQVYGGTEENTMSLILTAGLKKDNIPETFKLRNRTNEGLYLPLRYIKIVPIQSWGPSYSYTIWYVELHGIDNEDLVTRAIETISLRKEEEAVRILLKHLRRRKYKDAFEALSRETGVQLEGPIQARLWNALVENGDYKLAEEIFEQAANEGELEWYQSWLPYLPEWRQLSPCSAAVEARLCCSDAPAPVRSRSRDISCADCDPRLDANEAAVNGGEPLESCEDGGARPGPRGGHQLVVDPNTGTLYMFGGWNGSEDLDDLWSYSTTEEKWTLLCRHSHEVNGPSPRSCHKMVFDPVHERLFTLGRYLDNVQRLPCNMNSDLHVYSVSERAWALLCGDTAAAGGPRLVFDHQMCIDPDTQTVYVFGGRVLPANTEEQSASPQYSGLYAYYIATNTWQLLLPDNHDLPAPQPRVSHSMLFHPVQRRLYMFAGQRNKEQLVDAWWWDAASGRCGALCAGAARAPPPAGFTQRATLDPDRDEIYVLSGMSKEKDKRVYNTLWVLSLRLMTWTCVYRNDSVAPHEPRPRFAHQLVYDPVRKVHYLFGGNPGTASVRLRLDDLWALRLRRPAPDMPRARARHALRHACFRELAARPALAPRALHYLRTELRAATDHTDPAQVTHFQKLATVLFAGAADDEPGACALSPAATRALALRRARDAAPADLALALAVVLGADEAPPEPPQPFELAEEPAPDTWDVGAAPDELPGAARDAGRDARIRLYDQLCAYFRPSAVPPRADLTDLVTL